MIQVITSTLGLQKFCTEALQYPYIAVDTEFLREKTYYAQLCLIQLALPGDGDTNAILVDVQSRNLNLEPLYELFKNKKIVKVFHAARQDLEIFFVDAKIFPEPFFDTQIAAMVCGFGEQVAYETIVRKLALKNIDKSSRFSNWSQRPLTENQMSYALGDVTHLRKVYEELLKLLKQSGRQNWVDEEFDNLLKAETYLVYPADSWKRIKIRNNNPKFISAVQSLAKFREEQAQERNIPRNRILKDEVILELASIKPKTLKDLGKSRLLHNDAKRGWMADGIILAIKEMKELTFSDIDYLPGTAVKRLSNNPMVDLLKVLLKAKAEEWGVAAKLIATSNDIEILATNENPDLPALKGWRNNLFGKEALKLKNGKIALSLNSKGLKIVQL